MPYRDDYEHAQTFRKGFNQAFARIKVADVAILTLELSEVWFDKQTKLYLNASPHTKLITRYPARFELHVFDYEETLNYLEAIYGLLKRALKTDFRLMVTVSPIPLSLTFREQDVLVANAYSKAVLRTAVESFLRGKTNVNYFPSYEAVTLSNPNVVWRENDYRHVHSTFIDLMMGNVMAQFTDAQPSIYNENQYLKAKSLYYGNYLEEAKKLAKHLMDLEGKPSKELIALWAAMQLGLHGKNKSTLLYLLNYFKTYKEVSVIQHIVNLFLRVSIYYKKNFVGIVEVWDGCNLSGWACNLKRGTPVKIKIFAGEKLLLTKLANNPRPDVAKVHGEKHYNCGFSESLEKYDIEGKLVRVVFAETSVDLQNSPISYELKP